MRVQELMQLVAPHLNTARRERLGGAADDVYECLGPESRAEARAPGPVPAGSGRAPAGRIASGDRKLVGLHQTVDTGDRRSPARFRFPTVSGPFGARLFSDR